MNGSQHLRSRLSRFAIGATAVATMAGTFALLPSAAATAAQTGTVTAANPAIVPNNFSALTITFSLAESGSYLVKPQVTVSNPQVPTDKYTVTADSVDNTKHTVTATFDFTKFGAPAAPGAYDVEICNLDVTTGNCGAPDDRSTTSPLTLTSQQAPAVTSLSANRRASNAAPLESFQIGGSNFSRGIAVGFTPATGAPTFTTGNVTGTAISGILKAAGATPGTYDIRVTDTSGQSSLPNAGDKLTIVDPPSISATVPSTLAVGQGAGQNGFPAEAITLRVANFPVNDAAAVTFPPNSGLSATVQSVTTYSSTLTQIVANVSASADAPVGTPKLTLTDLTTGGTDEADIAVNAAPAVASVSPSTLGQGAASIPVTFTGTGIDPKASLVFPSSTGVTQSGTPTISSTSFQTKLSVASNAPTGKVPFSIVSPDGGHTDYTASNSPLTITNAPVLTSVSPSSVIIGATNTVLTLTGSHFPASGMQVVAEKADGVTPRTDVTFGSVSVPSGATTTATVPVTVAATAAPGPIALRVTNSNDNGTSLSNGLLTIDDFAVTGITPNSATNAAGNTAVPLQVSGTNIPAGTTQLKLTPTFAVTGQPPILVDPTSVSSSTWKGNANLAGVAPGQYQVQLVNGSHTGTCSCTFTVNSAGAPTVTKVSPAAIGQGADTTLTITGTNFARGASVTFSKPSSFATTGPVTFDSPTQLRVPVHVASNAPTGQGNASDVTLTLTGPTPNSGTCSQCLTATAGPTITSLNPSTLGQGAATPLTINGTGFDSKATVTFGTGVTATGTPTITSTQIKVPVKVDPKAPSSASIKVANPDLGTATTTLPITAGPTVSAVSPRYVSNTYADNITLTGTGFDNGATVTFPASSGVSVASGKSATVSGNGTTITVPIVVNRTTAAPIDVTVTNSATNFGSATCTGCLGVAVAPSAVSGLTLSRNGSSATVGWTALAGNATGGAPITGYTVSVTQPSNSGIAERTTTPSTTSTTYNNLDPATTYTFTIVAKNAASLSSPPASIRTSNQSPSRLALRDSAARLVYGQVLTLSGTLTNGATGAPIRGALVTVLRHNDSGRIVEVATVSTNSRGHYGVSIRPKHNGDYYAGYRGDSTHSAAITAAARTVVAPHVSIHSPAGSTTSSANPLVIKGTVGPHKPGKAVRLYAIDSHGRTHQLGTKKLSSRSTYRFKVALGHGKWRLVVRISKSPGNVAGHSKRLRVTRT